MRVIKGNNNKEENDKIELDLTLDDINEAVSSLKEDSDDSTSRKLFEVGLLFGSSFPGVVVTEKMKWDNECRKKYVDQKTGRFKGGKGKRFDNCVAAVMDCASGMKVPKGGTKEDAAKNFCAWLYRKSQGK